MMLPHIHTQQFLILKYITNTSFVSLSLTEDKLTTEKKDLKR